MLTFFVAGFETSSSTMTMCLHELAIHPDIQERLYQEIKEFKDTNNLTFENVKELKYLDAVLNGKILIKICVACVNFQNEQSKAFPWQLENSMEHTFSQNVFTIYEEIFKYISWIHLPLLYDDNISKLQKHSGNGQSPLSWTEYARKLTNYPQRMKEANLIR